MFINDGKTKLNILHYQIFKHLGRLALDDCIFVKYNKKQRALKTLQILHAGVSGPRVIIHVKVRGLRGCDCEE